MRLPLVLTALRLPLLALLLAAGSLAAAQTAPPSALSRLPDQTVQKLRDSITPTVSPAPEALRQLLEALESDSVNDGDGSAAVDEPARVGQRQQATIALRGSRAARHRAALRPLREQVQADLMALQAQLRGLAGDSQAQAVSRLAEQANQRFDRLDQALRRAETADVGDAAQAQRALTDLLRSLRAAPEPLPAGPVPTLQPAPALLRAPGQGGASGTLPQYARDLLRPQHQAADAANHTGFGYVKVAATLAPVSPHTTADCSATAADLADDGAEVRLTPEIRALAQSLDHSPARILRWMQLEIAFEPYWGSLKGALGTLQSRAGNATDQSSLLIALLRASNVPARFVRGTVAVVDQQPADNATGRAQRWLGTKNYSGAVAYLGGQVPAGIYTVNNLAQGVNFDHVWVQACVPYAAYRGSLADAGGYRWVPLDAVVKDHDYQAGIAGVNFGPNTPKFVLPNFG